VNTSKALTILHNYTPEKLNSMNANLDRYSAATIRKHNWIIPMYESFCQHVAANPWPIEANTVGNFLAFLGKEVCLANSSLTDVVVPGLKRIHKDKTGRNLLFIHLLVNF
jgi:hypothetical protein